jgi:hypothetical protein
MKRSVICSAGPLLFALAGCGDARSPVAPARGPGGAPIAYLAATMAVASTLTSSGGYRYEVEVEVTERAGVAATIECVEIAYNDHWHDPWPLLRLCGPDSWQDGNVIRANGVLRSRTAIIEEHFPFEYYRAFIVTITFQGATAPDRRAVLVHADAPPMPEPPAGARFELEGTVYDGTALGLGDVTVLVTSGANAGRKTTTARDGQYTLAGLESDTFSVRFSRAGYVETNASVGLTSNRSFDVRLSQTQ